MKITKLKKGVKTKAVGASKNLANTKYVADALKDALWAGDAEAFKEILSAHLEVINIKKDTFYKKAGVSRRSLFRMLSPEGNPTLENITKVISALREVA